jgi:hypothetical protein
MNVLIVLLISVTMAGVVNSSIDEVDYSDALNPPQPVLIRPASKPPSTFASIRRILTDGDDNPTSCIANRVAQVGKYLEGLPTVPTISVFAVYEACKACVKVCGANSRYLAPSPKKFCLIDIQGCTSDVIKCPKPFALRGSTRKGSRYSCRFHHG